MSQENQPELPTPPELPGAAPEFGEPGEFVEPVELVEIGDQSCFHYAKWSRRHLLVGLLVLLGAWSTSFLPRDVAKRIPFWVYMIATGIFLGFQIFHPFRGVRPRLGLPRIGIGKIFKEAGLAVPLTIGVVVMLAVVNYVWTLVAPETSLTPRVWENATRSNRYALVAIVMLIATTIGPVAEEIFFRGYLYNAFRTRFGGIIAMLVSSLVFAVLHSYEAAPTVVVFILGICLTGIYRWRKTLLTPIFVHAGINIVSVIGLVLSMLVYANAPMMGISSDQHADGVRITVVASESGADRAGIQVGDILIDIDNQPVKFVQDVSRIVRTHKIGDVVQVTLIRDNITMAKSVVLGPRPDESQWRQRP